MSSRGKVSGLKSLNCYCDNKTRCINLNCSSKLYFLCQIFVSLLTFMNLDDVVIVENIKNLSLEDASDVLIRDILKNMK